MEHGSADGGARTTVADAMRLSMMEWPVGACCGLEAGAEQWCQLMAKSDTYGDVVAHAIVATLMGAEASLYGVMPGSGEVSAPQVVRPLDGSATMWSAELLTLVGVHCVALAAVADVTTRPGRRDLDAGLRAPPGAAASMFEGQASARVERAEQSGESGMQVDEAPNLASGGEPRAMAAGKEALYSAERQRQLLSVGEASARPPGEGTDAYEQNKQTTKADGVSGEASKAAGAGGVAADRGECGRAEFAGVGAAGLAEPMDEDVGATTHVQELPVLTCYSSDEDVGEFDMEHDEDMIAEGVDYSAEGGRPSTPIDETERPIEELAARRGRRHGHAGGRGGGACETGLARYGASGGG